MTSPTLDTLTNSVFSDLSDTPKVVFTTAQVYDFIRAGVADLNRVAPLEGVESIALVTDPDTGIVTAFSYNVLMTLPYAVEIYRISDGYTEPVPQAVEGETVWTGWVFRETPAGGTIEFPQWYLQALDTDQFGLRLRGYTPRIVPTTGGSVIQLNDEDEYSVRAFAKAQAFDLLSHDRSLFAQWQGQTNNTDVSPTQMMQMAASAKQDWDHTRSHIRTVRRYW